MTSSVPLPAYAPRDDASALTGEERDILQQVMEDTGVDEAQRMGVVQMLSEVEWDDEAATTRVRKMDSEIKKLGTITRDDVLPFVGVDDAGVPLPCGVILEDGRGQCARTKRGSPIVLVYGNFECDTQAAIRQMAYLCNRLQAFIDKRELPHVTYVFDMKPREGKHTITTKLDLTFLRFASLYPQSYDVYLCAASPKAAAAFNMIPQTFRAKTHVCANYDVLHDAIDPVNMLPHWHPDGAFDFDLRKYREHLAATFDAPR